MKKIIIPKTPKYLDRPINDGIEIAFGFLCAKYGYRFNDGVMIIQPNAVRSRFFANDKTPHRIHGFTPVVTIATTANLYLYVKNSLGKYRQGVNIGYTLGIATSIIHELTHYVQYLDKRSYSELETTANELEFLRTYSPDWYERIMIK